MTRFPDSKVVYHAGPHGCQKQLFSELANLRTRTLKERELRESFSRGLSNHAASFPQQREARYLAIYEILEIIGFRISLELRERSLVGPKTFDQPIRFFQDLYPGMDDVLNFPSESSGICDHVLMNQSL